MHGRCGQHHQQQQAGRLSCHPGLWTAPTTATALATVHTIQPRRVWAGVGTGDTARKSLGLRALAAWKVRNHVREVRSLLAGEEIVHRFRSAERSSDRGSGTR